jgi:hypothetical protein
MAFTDHPVTVAGLQEYLGHLAEVFTGSYVLLPDLLRTAEKAL